MKLSRLLPTLAIVAAICAVSSASASASAATYSMKWHAPAHVTSVSGGFTAVSCPSATECLAVDAAGEVAWSRKPSTKAWSKAKIDKTGGGLTAISCPKQSFCVAVDANGQYVFSKDPTGGARKWSRPARIDAVKSPGGGYVGLAGVSCPSTTLCVAVDNAISGNVVVSSNPAGGAKTWRRATIAHGQQLTSISCPRTSLCVAAGTARYYATSVHAVAADWHAAGGVPGAGVLSAIGCAFGTKTCVSVGYNSTSAGFALATSSADGGGWSNHSLQPLTYPPANGGLLDGVACPRIGFCVAIDSGDSAYTTNSPVRGNWSAGRVIRSGALTNSSAISCAAKLCVVADNRGVVTSGSVRG